MVGRVGYAPTTPAMSMQYSTIELTAHMTKNYYFYYFFLQKKCSYLYLQRTLMINL